VTSRPPAGPTPSQQGAASSASPEAHPKAVGLDPREPIWPHPQPFTANLLKRFSRGLGSWFGLLNEWDFRIGIGSTNVLGLEMVLVNRPALVRQVLVDEAEAFPKHPYTQWILEPLIGQGLFAVNGAEWQRQRRLVDQALQVTQLRRVFPLMQGAVQAMLERIESQGAAPSPRRAPGLGTGQPGQGKASQGKEADLCFDAQEAMSLVTADVIVRTILSRPLDPREARTIFAAFARYQRRASLVMVLRFLRLPKPWLQRLLRADAGLIRSWIAAAIKERSRSQPGLAPGSSPAAGHQDLLAALERAHDRPDTPTNRGPTQVAEGAAEPLDAPMAGMDESKRGFSQDELVDQVCVLFLAGHETSASALAMACYLLARYPEAQARFAQEIEQVHGGTQSPNSPPSPHRPLDYADLRSLPYGAALLQETLRLYPPLSFFIRESQAARQLGESRCPMGALLAISPWVIQRHEQHWSEPNRFRPERFLADQACDSDKQWARDAYLPFGLGPRKCPGAAFALQEALLVLAELVSRYELLGEPGQEPELVGNLTLRSRNGVQLRLRRRP
jgi:cytochrome P450